jgi:hypothetical protein
MQVMSVLSLHASTTNASPYIIDGGEAGPDAWGASVNMRSPLQTDRSFTGRSTGR